MEEVSQFHIPIEPSHAILAQACLGVFLCLDDRTTEDERQEYSSLSICCPNIGSGTLRTRMWNYGLKDAMDYFFDMDNPHFSALVRIEHSRDFLRVSMDEEPTGLPRSAGPLYFAAWRGLRGLAERLIIKDPRHVNQIGGYLGTPLHASAAQGHIEVSQLLFAHGADINSRCADNFTPLHFASLYGYIRIVKWLLDHGADVNPKQTHSTPLHFAIESGHLDVCQILLKHNAEVNSRRDDGSTPLHVASSKWEEGSAIFVQLLLDYGADVRVRDLNGKTASEVASGPDQEKIVQLLSQHTAE
jgi:hypothetical protein